MGKLCKHTFGACQNSYMPNKMLFLLVSLLLVVSTQAKVYDRCDLARELVNNQGFARATVGNWVCLVQWESSYNTGATNHNSNGSTDYGLFQINDNYWCDDTGAGNDCNIACNKLLDSSISDDCSCAKKIWAVHKFEAWYGWKNHCKGHDVEEYVKDCF